MKVLLINGSPKANGNTSIALNEMIKVFAAEDVETELIHVGTFTNFIRESSRNLKQLEEYHEICNPFLSNFKRRTFGGNRKP